MDQLIGKAISDGYERVYLITCNTCGHRWIGDMLDCPRCHGIDDSDDLDLDYDSGGIVG